MWVLVLLFLAGSPMQKLEVYYFTKEQCEVAKKNMSDMNLLTSIECTYEVH